MRCGKQGSWHEAAEDLRTKLSRYAAKSRFNEEFEEAFAFYFGEGPSEMQDELEPATFSRFMEWFVYDYRLSNGHRLIEMFEMEYNAELSCRTRYLLGEWQRSSVTLMEILSAGRESFQARDLLLGGDYHVRMPPSGHTEGSPGAGRLLIGRLVRVGDTWELPAGAVVLPLRLRDRLLQLVRGEFRRYHRTRGGAWEEFLREQGFVFNDMIDNLSAEIVADDEVGQLAVRAVYDIVDMKGCVRVLRGVVDRAAGPSGELGLAPQRANWPGLVGELRLTSDRLDLLCDSQVDLARSKRAVADRLGRAVKHRFDVFERRRAASSSEELLHGGGAATSDGNPASGCTERTKDTIDLAAEETAVSRDELSERGRSDDRPAAVRQPEWSTDAERRVVDLFSQVLAQTGASQEHVDSAMWIWADYCATQRPRVRQATAWAAAVHVTLGKVEGWRLRPSVLARIYGTTPTSVSRNAATIAAVLDIKQFDDRYCVEHPVDGLLKRLGALTEHDILPQQAEEIMGPSVAMKSREVNLAVARLVELRGLLAAYAQRIESLVPIAQDYFAEQVGSSLDDSFWRDCFVDWLHFDWRIPVRGGVTLLDEALASDELGQAEKAVLSGWRGCHPAYYQVESVRRAVGPAMAQVSLRPLRGEGSIKVAWPLSVETLRRGDILLARLVLFEGTMTSIGHALHFSTSLAPAIKLRLDEERALLEHWNGRRLTWDELSARYAERLYAIAYRAARGFPDE